MRIASKFIPGLMLFVTLMLTGCDTIEGIFDSGEETEGTVEAIAAAAVTVSGNVYVVNGDTEFEGDVTSLADNQSAMQINSIAKRSPLFPYLP